MTLERKKILGELILSASEYDSSKKDDSSKKGDIMEKFKDYCATKDISADNGGKLNSDFDRLISKIRIIHKNIISNDGAWFFHKNIKDPMIIADRFLYYIDYYSDKTQKLISEQMSELNNLEGYATQNIVNNNTVDTKNINLGGDPLRKENSKVQHYINGYNTFATFKKNNKPTSSHGSNSQKLNNIQLKENLIQNSSHNSKETSQAERSDDSCDCGGCDAEYECCFSVFMLHLLFTVSLMSRMLMISRFQSCPILFLSLLDWLQMRYVDGYPYQMRFLVHLLLYSY